MFEGPVVLIYCILLCAALAFGYKVYRRKQVAAVAQELGLTFRPTVQMLDVLGDFELMSPGHSRRFINCMEGDSSGTSIKLFEYCFSVGYGQRKIPRTQTVAYLKSDEFQIPSFRLRPRSFADKLGLTGSLSISPEFDKKFVVDAEDDRCVRQLFDSNLIDHVMGTKWSIEASEAGLIVYTWDHTVNHTLLEKFMKKSLKVMLLLRNNISSSEPLVQEPEIVMGEDGRLRLAKV